MTHDVSRRHRFSCLALILWVALVSARIEGQEGFSHLGQLYRLDLSTDGSAVSPVVEVGDPGIAGFFNAMALGPDGRLFAVSWDGPVPSEWLYVVDPETADATLVGELDISGQLPSGMTFDDEGRLWLLAETRTPPYQSALYLVDHLTAATTEILTGMDRLKTLGFRDGVFYGIVEVVVNSVGEFTLVSINQATGDLTPIVELTGFEPDEPPGEWCFRRASAMDFDDEGRLWIAASWYRFCTTIPGGITVIHYYANPFDGARTSLSPVVSSTGSPLRLRALAVRGPSQAVLDIPTLSFGGALILATALAAMGMALVRRRS